jgi:acyl-CoA-binding protein
VDFVGQLPSESRIWPVFDAAGLLLGSGQQQLHADLSPHTRRALLTPGASLSDDTKLLLYALQQQAQQGPCKDPKPWGWNVVESAKWQSWTQLGTMPNMEAMRLYVRTLDELQVGMEATAAAA